MSKGKKPLPKPMRHGSANPVPRRRTSAHAWLSGIFQPHVAFSERPLIRFDRKTLVFLGILLVLYVLAGVLRLHTSSVARWDQMFGQQEPASVLWGKPRPIRQDEWMVQTPGIIGQVRSGMPISHETFGAGNVPVLSGYPVRDISMLIRPNLWPYFIFDLETAFAFSWDFNIFIFLATTFLLFLVLTGSAFWISAAGALVLYLSGAMQWWSYALGVGMTWLNIALVSVIYLLYSPRKWHQYLAGLGLLVGAYNFFASLYPPWHIPLGYLYGALFLGVMIKHHSLDRLHKDATHRIMVAAGALLVLAAFAWHHASLLKETYAMLLNTAYPGRRIATGGDLIDGKFFSEFFGIFMTDTRVPPTWLNICEASAILPVFPVVFYAMVRQYVKTREANALQVALAIYILVVGCWLLVGFPEGISRLTFFSMSPAYRTLPVFGVANIFLLITWLGDVRRESPSRGTWIEASLLAVGILIFLRMTAAHINDATQQFFSAREVNIMTLLILTLYLLIRYAGIRFVMPALLSLFIAINLPNFRIHPGTQGLDALLENPLVKLTSDIQKAAPEARWCVFGMQRLSNLLKANGINVFNGVKVVPLMDDLAILDPAGRDANVYNRYAHVNMERYITNQDTVVFRLNENNVVNDNYTIFMDPCSPRLVELGVSHYLFTYQPPPEEVRCMTLLGQYSNLFIYQRNPS